MVNKFKNWFGSNAKSTSTSINAIANATRSAADNVTGTARNTADSISGSANEATNWATEATQEKGNAVRNVAGNISNTVKNSADGISGSAKDAGKWAKKVTQETSNKAKSAAGGITKGATEGNIGIENKATNYAQNATSETTDVAGKAWQGASSSVSNLGIQTQNGGSWLKKGLPLIAIIAVGVWAVSYFDVLKPISSSRTAAEGSLQTLDANAGEVMEATAETATIKSVKGALSTVSLPNGEKVEFPKGSFEHLDDNTVGAIGTDMRGPFDLLIASGEVERFPGDR